MTKSQNKKSFWDFVNNLKASLLRLAFSYSCCSGSKINILIIAVFDEHIRPEASDVRAVAVELLGKLCFSPLRIGAWQAVGLNVAERRSISEIGHDDIAVKNIDVQARSAVRVVSDRDIFRFAQRCKRAWSSGSGLHA
jgi:hypothetical protein